MYLSPPLNLQLQLNENLENKCVAQRFIVFWPDCLDDEPFSLDFLMNFLNMI